MQRRLAIYNGRYPHSDTRSLNVRPRQCRVAPLITTTPLITPCRCRCLGSVDTISLKQLWPRFIGLLSGVRWQTGLSFFLETDEGLLVRDLQSGEGLDKAHSETMLCGGSFTRVLKGAVKYWLEINTATRIRQEEALYPIEYVTCPSFLIAATVLCADFCYKIQVWAI